MPRIRSIKPGIWDDDAIGEASREARLLYVALITQADDDGRLPGNPRWLTSKIYPFDDLAAGQVEGWLDELDRAGLIQRYEHAGRPYLRLLEWEGSQKIDKRWYKPSDLPEAPDEPSSSTRRAPNEPSTQEGRGEEGGEDQDRNGGESEGTGAVASDDTPLSHLLADLVEENGSKRPRVTKRWVDAERLLLGPDGRDRGEAEQLIRWCQRDDFWRGNVLSMPAFRKQYDRLRLHAQRGNGNGSAASSASADIAELGELAEEMRAEEAGT